MLQQSIEKGDAASCERLVEEERGGRGKGEGRGRGGEGERGRGRFFFCLTLLFFVDIELLVTLLFKIFESTKRREWYVYCFLCLLFIIMIIMIIIFFF